jgi:hypothetical protein
VIPTIGEAGLNIWKSDQVKSEVEGGYVDIDRREGLDAACAFEGFC